MGLTAKEPDQKDFEKAPAGTHLARCVQVIDLGTQFSAFYGKSKHKVLIGWELPNELQTSQEGPDEPFLVWNRYTLSLHQNSSLRGHLEAWRNRPFSEHELEGFDLRAIMGKGCNLNVQHSDDGYANVMSVMALRKGDELPAQVHPDRYFDIEDWDDKVFDTLSENLQKTILGSPEAKARDGKSGDPNQELSQQPPDDEIPF